MNKIGFEDLEPYKTAWFSKSMKKMFLPLFDLEPYKTAWFSKSIGKNLRFRTISDYMKVNYMTKIVAVKKIEIYIDGSEEEKESFYKFFRTNSKKYVQALNYVYSQKIYEDLIQENIKQLDEEYVKKVQHYTKRIDEINGELKNNLTIKQEQKLKKSLESSKNRLSKLRNNKSKEARAVLDEAIGIKERTRSADTAKKVNFDFSGFYPLASKQASQDYSNDYVEIKTGKRTPRIYRYIWNRCSLPFGSRDIRIVKDGENKFYVSIPRGYRFRLFFGRKPRLIADYTDFLNKIINEEYQLNESKIVTDGKKFYFHFTITFEKEYNNLALDDSKSLYVNFDDIGSGNLTNDEGKELCKFGDTAYIVRFKKRIQSIKNREKSRGTYAKGSHGRKRKLNYDRWEAIKLREGNFVKTYNNQCTSRIVKVATDNKCGNIVVNFIDKENLGEWAYYQFMEQLERSSSYHKLLTNLYIPRTDGTTTEIDLLFINNKGIFVIESKNYSGWIFGDEKQKFWTQTFQTKKKYHFFNPVWQNNAHINALKEVLVPSYSEVLQSIIIFSNQCELKKITLYSDHVTIIQRKQLKGKMNSIQKEKSNCLEKEQIDSIANSLKNTLIPVNSSNKSTIKLFL